MILIITGVYRPEPVVSAQIIGDLRDRLRLNQKRAVVLCPFPSRPLGMVYSDLKEEEDVFRVASYVAKSDSLLSRFIESISFTLCVLNMAHKFKQVDLIYNAGWFLPSRFLVAIYCRLMGLQYIVPVQDIYPESLGERIGSNFIGKILFRLLLKADRYVLAHAKGIQVISPSMLNYLSVTRNIYSENFTLIYNWTSIQLNKERSSLHRRNGVYFLGNLGRLSGVDSFVENWINSGAESLLVIGGSGVLYNQIKAMIGENDSVKLTNVEKGCEEEFLSSAKFGLLPVIESINNNSIPSKAILYLGMGLPIVTNLPSDNDLYKILSRYGCLVDLKTCLNISSYLDKLSEIEYAELSNGSLRCFEEVFSREVNLKKLVKMFGL